MEFVVTGLLILIMFMVADIAETLKRSERNKAR